MLRANPTLQLQPWGRIEGRCLAGAIPAPGRELLLQTLDGARGPFLLDRNAFKITSDAEGRFVYPKVPPGNLKLTRSIRSKLEDKTPQWAYGGTTEVEVKPGGTTEVIVADEGSSN